jgi:head-tail adaptor
VTKIGELTRRVTFQRRGLDENDEPSPNEPWVDVVSRAAKIVPMKGGEGVQSQRLEGSQPVVIIVRREALTRNIDNSYRAVDARDTDTVWGVTSAIWNEREDMMEFLAVQRRNGSDA